MSSFPLTRQWGQAWRSQNHSRGPEVKNLQRFLNITRKPGNSLPPLAEDGVFGENTEAALLAQYNLYNVTQDWYSRIVLPVLGRVDANQQRKEQVEAGAKEKRSQHLKKAGGTLMKAGLLILAVWGVSELENRING